MRDNLPPNQKAMNMTLKRIQEHAGLEPITIYLASQNREKLQDFLLSL